MPPKGAPMYPKGSPKYNMLQANSKKIVKKASPRNTKMTSPKAESARASWNRSFNFLFMIHNMAKVHTGRLQHGEGKHEIPFQFAKDSRYTMHYEIQVQLAKMSVFLVEF